MLQQNGSIDEYIREFEPLVAQVHQYVWYFIHGRRERDKSPCTELDCDGSGLAGEVVAHNTSSGDGDTGEERELDQDTLSLLQWVDVEKIETTKL